MRQHPTRPTALRRAGAALVAAVCVSLLTGCVVGMPTSGPVTETGSTGTQSQDRAVNINPRRPGVDDPPEAIVRGFLEAMTATPAITTSVAREFLTTEAAANWKPTQTIIYATATARGAEGERPVSVTLGDAHRTDSRGAWLGALSPGESTLEFPVGLQDGQWRISAPPDALIVPQSWFEARFRQASLYFFDPSASILVPEPVFVPRGRQLASALVDGLLSGPSSALSPYELTFLPSDLRSLVSVSVSSTGVAQVDLANDAGGDLMPPPAEAELLVAQLAWTLRQDPSIEAFRVSIGGRPVQLPDQSTTFSTELGAEYAPYASGASAQLFGLRDGALVSGTTQGLDAVSGPFGSGDLALRTASPNLSATQAAVVAESGTEVLVGPVRAGADDPAVTRVGTGEDFLDPAWDFADRLWLVDRRSSGSVVSYVQGGRPRTLDVPGISGADVKSFLVSRDGSRLVAVVRVSPDTDALLVSRILTSGEGRVVRALPAVSVTEGTDFDSAIRAVAWRSPTSLLVLHPVSRRLFQVRTASVDGSPVGPDAVAVTLDRDISGLAGSPVPGAREYAVAQGALSDLAGPRANTIDVDPSVTALGYVG